MANFDDILKNLHDSATLEDAEILTPIAVTSNRTFEVPNGYNLILAYAGDVNSQIVTFQFPKFHEKHDLSKCQKKKIKWKNLTSGTEGRSNLKVIDDSSEDKWTASWEVPPEIMTAASVIEIGISLYDIYPDSNLIAFSWNTATFRGFFVSESFSEVGDVWDEGYYPAKNEILNISVDNRNIVAPSGYNSVIANFGDIGISKVFFQTNRYIRGIDLLGDTTEVSMNVSLGDSISKTYLINKEFIRLIFKNDESEKTDKVLIVWDVPSEITNNEYSYIGNITISFKIIVKVNDVITKRWTTSAYSGLSIGSSLLIGDIIGFAERNEQIVREIIEETTGEVVDGHIDNYFDERSFIIT